MKFSQSRNSLSELFEKQIVAVVGAASGIGAATASIFQSRGATVVGIDRASIREGSCDKSFVVDATDYGALTACAADCVEVYGKVDHMVVSIGMCSGTFGFPFWNLDPDIWKQTVNVNLIAPVNVAHAFVPHMAAQRSGTFCFVTSVAGQMGSQTDPPYSAAKAGLINFTQCAAKDLAPYNIRANAVSPGMVKTPMNRYVWEAWSKASPENNLSYDEWAESKIAQVAPLARWQTNEDIAEAICFLASDAAKNITGQTLNVDGGQVMHS